MFLVSFHSRQEVLLLAVERVHARRWCYSFYLVLSWLGRTKQGLHQRWYVLSKSERVYTMLSLFVQNVTSLLSSSGNAPSYMQYNPSMWMFDELDDCCDRHYLWDLATCLGASATAGSDKWFVDYFLNKCVKECVGAEPCGGLVDGSWVDLFESQSECCSKKMWWNTECDAWGVNERVVWWIRQLGGRRIFQCWSWSKKWHEE